MGRFGGVSVQEAHENMKRLAKLIVQSKDSRGDGQMEVESSKIKKLRTIQKRKKLNDVYAVGEKGNGGAYHGYRIHKEGTLTYDDYIAMIDFQDGARDEEGSHDGVLDVDLLEIVKDRLICFQAGDYPSKENEQALQHVTMALLWMNKRVEDRIERDVLGKNQK